LVGEPSIPEALADEPSIPEALADELPISYSAKAVRRS